MYTEALYRKFEDYLAHRLDEQARNAFEEELKHDAEVRALFRAHQQADGVIAHAVDKELKEKLSAFDRDLDREMKETSALGSIIGYRLGKYIAIAASLVLVLGLAIHFWTGYQRTPAILAHKNLVEINNQTRGEQTVDGPFEIIKNAQEAFKNRQYPEAARHYQTIIDGKSLLVESAEFNLALALLAQEKMADAVQKLQDIARDKDHQYQDEATSLLEKIN